MEIGNEEALCKVKRHRMINKEGNASNVPLNVMMRCHVNGERQIHLWRGIELRIDRWRYGDYWIYIMCVYRERERKREGERESQRLIYRNSSKCFHAVDVNGNFASNWLITKDRDVQNISMHVVMTENAVSFHHWSSDSRDNIRKNRKTFRS